MQIPLAAILYVVLSLLVGVLGRKRAVGFSGFFVLSLLVSPLVMGLVLLVGSARDPA
jgi:hypothetical protein